jgi:hypothetical protein
VNGTTEDEITEYVRAVREALPESTRDELLEDLPEHLAEVLAEGTGTLVERLGTPEAYAAELLATAGYVGGFPDAPPAGPDKLAELSAAVMAKLRVADVRVGPVLGYERASEFLVLLRPAWWVLRGYLVAMLVAWILNNGREIGLLPRVGGSAIVALALLAAGIYASIWFGRRTAGGLAKGPRYALYAGTTVLVLIAFGAFLNADQTWLNQSYRTVDYNNNPYSGVQDVYVYDQQGRLVPNARIFDQDGQPIRMGNPYCYDPVSGGQAEVTTRGYPYCPSNAPFDLSPSASPSASPSGSATPQPTPSPSATR